MTATGDAIAIAATAVDDAGSPWAIGPRLTGTRIRRRCGLITPIRLLTHLRRLRTRLRSTRPIATRRLLPHAWRLAGGIIAGGRDVRCLRRRTIRLVRLTTIAATPAVATRDLTCGRSRRGSRARDSRGLYPRGRRWRYSRGRLWRDARSRGWRSTRSRRGIAARLAAAGIPSATRRCGSRGCGAIAALVPPATILSSTTTASPAPRLVIKAEGYAGCPERQCDARRCQLFKRRKLHLETLPRVILVRVDRVTPISTVERGHTASWAV